MVFRFFRMLYRLIGIVGRVFANGPGDQGIVAIKKGAFRSHTATVAHFTYEYTSTIINEITNQGFIFQRLAPYAVMM